MENIEDIATTKAKQIADAIQRLLDVEQAEENPDSDDVKSLQDALASMQKFMDSEAIEPKEMPDEKLAGNPVVDTNVLTGPMPALKNFLLKSQRDNETK